MRIFVGQTRAPKWIRKCESHGFGELTCRGELPPRRRPWAYDNGAYRDWQADKPFDYVRWTRDLRMIRDRALAPDFAVLPDVPARSESIDLSLEWLSWARDAGGDTPQYVAVQDGMEFAHVERLRPAIAGVFVGGTLAWKIRTGAYWVREAHARGMKCHIGRVGTPSRVQWAREIGADSIDSALPLRSANHFEAFVAACNGLLPQARLL